MKQDSRRQAPQSRTLVQNIAGSLRLSYQADRRLFVLAVGLPAVAALFGVGQLFVIRGAAQAFVGRGPAPDAKVAVEAMLPWLGAAVGLTIVSASIDNIREVIRELLSEHVKRLTATRMHRAIAALDLIDFDRPEIHDRMTRAEATADYRPTQVVRSSTSLLAAALRATALVGWLFLLEPLLVPAVLLTVVPIFFVSTRLAGQRFQFIGRVTPLERRRRYLGQLMSTRQPAPEVRSFGLMAHLSERYDRLSRERLDELRALLGKQRRSLLGGQLALGLLLTSSIAVLGWFYYSGRLGTPEVIAAAMALSQLGAQLGSLGWPLSELAEAGLFLSDQQEFYRYAQGTSGADRAGPQPEPLDELRVENLSFRYPAADRDALKDVTMTIRAGELVAFVGPNGSGKTTLAKILAFLYEPTSGEVRWNGLDSAAYDQEALRDQVTTVFQDHVTYQFTVAENVSIGDVRRAPDRAGIDRAIDDAGAGDIIGRLPNGVDTQLGPEFADGTSLSGGEAQRIAIARSFYRSRELVILDEPTSALDAQSDHALLNDIKAHLNGRTAIVVSHRFSNVRNADRIFVLDKGEVVESGTHESLMALQGLYSEMYTLQASVFTEVR
ncbi:ABC transporter ATP-binding protein [Kitasatospora sp. NPDC018058]|uniref:ABC transporter ATP-binding protein n=1 Tax=Kitasatospora sp. NPDC018058 TaxID=3364025 RepID=UPI0037BFA2B3